MTKLQHAQKINMTFEMVIIDTLAYALYLVKIHIDPYQEYNS